MPTEYACYAPVFRSRSRVECIFVKLFTAILIAMLILATIGLILLFPEGRCLIRQLLFRANYCTKGNTDPKRLI
jgi:hypothetical protein